MSTHEPLTSPTGGSRVGAKPPRTLYVAGLGGHLSQLTQLAPRITPLGEPLWVSFDGPQSRSLLRDCDVRYVRHTAPRDPMNVARNLAPAARLMREHNIVEVISTGSAVALSFLPMATALGIPCHFIESAARGEGPSITGRMLEKFGGVRLYTQYRTLSRAGWHLSGSVFDQFAAAPEPVPVDASRLKVLVSLGTMPYRFDRMVRAIIKALPPGADVTWQVGENYYGTLPGRVVNMLPAAEFAEIAEHADVMISHAGVGSALTGLRSGRHPVLVPRVREQGEHVDNHQRFIARELDGRGLATCAYPMQITTDLLLNVASRHIRTDPHPPEIALLGRAAVAV